MARGANFLLPSVLLILFVNSCVAIRYLTTFQDPSISPRSQFAYQSLPPTNLKFRYLAAFGSDADPNSTDANSFEFHNVEYKDSPLAQDSSVTLPIFIVKRYGYSEFINTNYPGHLRGVSSTALTPGLSKVVVQLSSGVDVVRNITTDSGLTINLDYAGNLSFNELKGVGLTNKAGGAIYAVEDIQTYYVVMAGYNASNGLYYNDVIYAGVSQTTAPTGIPPTPRAYYSSAYITSASRIFVFGGKNNTAYFNDVFEFLISGNRWNQVTVSGTIPPRRAGASLTQLFGRDTTLYLFGGTNGTYFFNDLWRLDVNLNSAPTSATWTRLDNPSDPLHARVTGRAFHRAADLVNDTANVLFFIGGKAADGSTPPATAVDVSQNCAYYCPTLPETCIPIGTSFLCAPKAGCVSSFDDCQKASVCAATQVKCGVNCVDYNITVGFAGCPPRPVGTPCPSGQVPCWNSECAPDASSCPVYPACPINNYRCPDGTCVPDSVNCAAAPTCAEKLCPDGLCRSSTETCTPVLGCNATSGSNFQCADGICRASLAECEAAANCTINDGYNAACWFNCTSSYLLCDLPHWVRAVKQRSDTLVINANDAKYVLVSAEYSTNSHIFIRVQNSDSTTKQFSWTVKRTLESEVMAIGPHPTWNEEFSPNFITSVVANINTNAVAGVSGPVDILFRHQFQNGDPNPISTSKLCFGTAVAWYWDDMDSDPTSQLANVSYIQAYREWYLDYLKNNPGVTKAVANSSQIFGQPATRWKCLNEGGTESGNQWPKWLDAATNPIANATLPDQWHGIVLLGELTGPTAIIKWNKTTVDSTAPTVPPPAEPNELAHYIVLGVVAVVLLVLIIVVTVKAVTSKN